MSRSLGVMLLTTAENWRGSGISYAKLARGFTERGHRVDLVVSSSTVAAEYARLGIPARQLSLDRTGAREVLSLLTVARANKTEIVIVDKPRDLRLAAWMSMVRPLKIVIRYNRVGRRRPSRFVDRWTAGRAAAALFQNEYIREKALAELPILGELRAFVIPNGYDVAEIESGSACSPSWREAHGIAANERVVISVGFAESEKRFDLSVDAMGLLASRGINATFVFCGDGPCRVSLEAKARERGVKAKWLGAQSSSDTLAAIAAADVVAHPSPVEIFGNVLAEAMALSTPIVAMRAGGNVEILGDDGTTAILLDDERPESLADGIAELLANPERSRALAAAAHARLVTIFPLSRMIDGYDTMMQSISVDLPEAK
ncbi:MAG: glycosyltransferase family 4 protein [Gemmatimonadota bacterium]|nr:glycosyltransferase family 4 protein [Gemmatimonadota bacterium]